MHAALAWIIGIVVLVALFRTGNRPKPAPQPAQAISNVAAEKPSVSPHEQRLADLRKKRESLEWRVVIERERAKTVARDAIKLSLEPLPDPDERRFLMEQMDKEEQRAAELVQELNRIDAEIAEEEQATREQASVADLPAIPGVTDAAPPPRVAQTGPCLSYAPAAVTLTGGLTSKTFPGRPNYESVEKGDEPETYWTLNLGQPLCTNQSEDASNVSVHDVSLLQLLFTNAEMYQTHRSLLDTNVKVTGYLFSATTGHHHTPVMLQVTSMEPVQIP